MKYMKSSPTKAERASYNAYRLNSCEELGITVNEYNALRRLSERLHRVYEAFCSGEIDEDEETRQRDELIAKVKKITDQHNLFVFEQTDPRGASLYLSTERVKQDNYTRVGVCIY